MFLAYFVSSEEAEIMNRFYGLVKAGAEIKDPSNVSDSDKKLLF